MAKAKPKNKGGRPLKFKTVKDLEKVCDAYFNECKEGSLPVTITGLALAIGSTRQTVMDYQNSDKFTDAIKRYKLRCENYAEIQLFTGQQTGAIFALKNYGWKDKQEIENTDTGVAEVLKELAGRLPD